MLRELCLDTETTGLDPKSGHRIIEIGCVELLDRVPTGNNYHIYINPEREVPDGAYRVHGISTEFLSDKPKFEEIVQSFLDYIKEDTLVIHNAAFDVRFLNHELELTNNKPIELLKTIDTLAIARKKFPGAPASLDMLCKRFAVDSSKRTLHGALLDAELLALVYIELMGGSQTRLDLNQQATEYPTSESKRRSNKTKREARHFPLSDQQVKRHKEFIKKSIPDSIW